MPPHKELHTIGETGFTLAGITVVITALSRSESETVNGSLTQAPPAR